MSAVIVVAVFALFTVCVNVLAVLPLKFVSLAYVAVIGCAPTDNVEVISVACPLESVCVPPNGVPLSKNCTVPVGVPLPGATAATVAVNVTLCPNTDGFAEDANVVVVFALFTVCEVVPKLVLKLPSPAYVAVIVFDPANVKANAQLPAATVPVQLFPLPSLTVTVTFPLGVPMPGATTLTV